MSGRIIRAASTMPAGPRRVHNFAVVREFREKFGGESREYSPQIGIGVIDQA